MQFSNCWNRALEWFIIVKITSNEEANIFNWLIGKIIKIRIIKLNKRK